MIDNELRNKLIQACESEYPENSFRNDDGYLKIPYTEHGYRAGNFTYWANAEWLEKHFHVYSDRDRRDLDTEWLSVYLNGITKEDAEGIIDAIEQMKKGCLDPEREEKLRKETLDEFIEDEFFENSLWKKAKKIIYNDKGFLNSIKERNCWFVMPRSIIRQVEELCKNKVIVMDAGRDAYSSDEVGDTLTVGELIEILEEYDSIPVVVASDNGYTYGSLSDSNFRDSNGKCKIKVDRDAYSIEDIEPSFTTNDMIEVLEYNFDEDVPVVFSHDGGYTYGACTEDSIYEDSYADVSTLEESTRHKVGKKQSRMKEATMSLDDYIEEMKDAVKSHNSGKADHLTRQADRDGFYISTNMAMNSFMAGVYNDRGFVDDEVLYIPTGKDWDVYEGDKKKWPKPYCDFLQIRNDNHVKMKESARLHEAELKSYRTIKGMLPKFIKKFLAVFDKAYDELYNSDEDEPAEAVEMFDKLLKDKTWKLFIGMCASQRGDIFSSDREACAFVIAVQRFFGKEKLTESRLTEDFDSLDSMYFNKDNDPEGAEELFQLVKEAKDAFIALENVGEKLERFESKSEDIHALAGYTEDLVNLVSLYVRPSEFFYYMRKYLTGRFSFADVDKGFQNWAENTQE